MWIFEIVWQTRTLHPSVWWFFPFYLSEKKVLVSCKFSPRPYIFRSFLKSYFLSYLSVSFLLLAVFFLFQQVRRKERKYSLVNLVRHKFPHQCPFPKFSSRINSKCPFPEVLSRIQLSSPEFFLEPLQS